jgi:hypothetical protein
MYCQIHTHMCIRHGVQTSFDIKEIKHILNWWAKHESMFPTIAFLACQILGILKLKQEGSFLWLVSFKP